MAYYRAALPRARAWLCYVVCSLQQLAPRYRLRPKIMGSGSCSLMQGVRGHDSVEPYGVKQTVTDKRFTVEELQAGVNLATDETHVLKVRRKPAVVRFSGLLFDTNKNFLLPVALPSLKVIGKLYQERPGNTVLIVGHTDTTGEVAYNDVLSLERAEAVAAYLQDDFGAWLKRYDNSVPENKRWGSAEDLMMIHGLARGETDEEEPIRAFQDSRKLQVDGIAGPKTREVLIKEYMSRDQTTLPSDCKLEVHGCGEHFPLADSGTEVDTSAADNKEDPLDRRVELFFFDGPVEPSAPGKNSSAGSTQYPEWRKTSEVVFARAFAPPRQLRVRLRLNGKAIVGERYELRIDGVLLVVSTTRSEGLVSQVLPDDARRAEITFPELHLVRTLDLKPAESFPSTDTLAGVQIRLNQLGFHCGEVDGALNDVTRDAIAHFKSVHGLGNDSELTDETRTKLAEEYGA